MGMGLVGEWCGGAAQVVVLGQVLAADINIGYEEMVNTRVRAINGAEVRNLAGLVEAAEACAEQYIKLDLDYNQVRVFPRIYGCPCALSGKLLAAS